MARRGRNIYKRKDGRWEGRLKRRDASLKGKYKSFYGRTYGEVKGKMEDYLRQIPQKPVPGNMTLGEAAEIWLKDNRSIWKPSTYACYMQLTQKYILPQLGPVPCEKINNCTLIKLQQQINLSKAYLKNICGIVIKSLKHVNAVYEKDFPVPKYSAAHGQSAPEAKFENDSIPSFENLKKLEVYLQNHLEDQTCAGILLAMYTGIRIGELCALRWEDIDLKNGLLFISRTMQRVKQFEEGGKTKVEVNPPKSQSSVRRIPIPLAVLTNLQNCACCKKGYVIRGKKQEFAEPRTLQYRLEAILSECEIPRFNFHKLRHAFASVCLMQGFDFKSLSELMGHSSIQTTLNIYVHSNEARKKALMEHLTLYEVA